MIDFKCLVFEILRNVFPFAPFSYETTGLSFLVLLVVERRICSSWGICNSDSARMTSSTDEDSKADTYKPIASGDSPTEEVKPKEPKPEEVQASPQVKEEPMAETDDINVFGDDDSKDDQDWVASQEAIKEVPWCTSTVIWTKDSLVFFLFLS